MCSLSSRTAIFKVKTRTAPRTAAAAEGARVEELQRRGLPEHSTVRPFRFPAVRAGEDKADPTGLPHSHLCPPDHLRQVRHQRVTFGVPTAVYAAGNASGSIFYVLMLWGDEGTLTRQRLDFHRRLRPRAGCALDNPDGDALEPNVTPPSVTHFGGANEMPSLEQRTYCVRALRRAVDEREPVASVGPISGTVTASLSRIYSARGRGH